MIKPHTIQDWHPADIVAALKKSGWSLRKLSETNGYNPGSLARSLRHPWPQAERVIAQAIGVHPAVIWPTRYNAQGTSNRIRGRPKKDDSMMDIITTPPGGNTDPVNTGGEERRSGDRRTGEERRLDTDRRYA